MKFVVGLWQLGSGQFSASTAADKLAKLELAVQHTASRGFQFLKASVPSDGFHSIFLAPEYFHAAPGAGSWNRDEVEFNPRSIDEGAKDLFVQGLKGISQRYKSTLILPGTVAWKKSLFRPGEKAFKKDKSTGLPTAEPKTQSRVQKATTALNEYQTNIGEHKPQNVASSPLKVVMMRYVMTDVLNLCTTAEVNARFQELYKANESRILEQTKKLISNPKPLVDKGIITEGQLNANMDVVPTTDKKLSELALGNYNYVMRNTAYVLLGGAVRFKYNKIGDFHEAIGDSGSVFIPGAYKGYFELGETGFGVEVCLDHAYGVLAETLKNQLPKKTPKIHMLVSDSTGNKAAKVTVDSGVFGYGGFFLHASTDATATGVYYKKVMSGELVKMTPISETDTVDGCTIRYYELEM